MGFNGFFNRSTCFSSRVSAIRNGIIQCSYIERRMNWFSKTSKSTSVLLLNLENSIQFQNLKFGTKTFVLQRMHIYTSFMIDYGVSHFESDHDHGTNVSIKQSQASAGVLATLNPIETYYARDY